MITMTAPRPERDNVHARHDGHLVAPPVDQEDREAWQDLQAVLEERDREWWADAQADADPDE